VLKHVAVLLALAAQTTPAFEVASIRPSADPPPAQAALQITAGQFRVGNLALWDCIAFAYRLQSHQISGPDWLRYARFDIVAKLPDGAMPQQVSDMLQSLLADRFQLRVHRESRDVPVYALEVADGGLKLERVELDRDAGSTVGAVASAGSSGMSLDLGRGASFSVSENRFEAKKLMMTMLAQRLTAFVGRPVVDRTNVPGHFDLALDVSPEDFAGMLVRAADAAARPLSPQMMRLLETTSMDTLSESLRKVGLSLAPARTSMDVLIVDSVQRMPSGN
jgi:uncharacterized protein (TIGR03435 family)